MKKQNISVQEIISILEASRKEKKMSYGQVAKLTENNRSSIWRILTGFNEPSSITLFKLIDVLGYDFTFSPKTELKPVYEKPKTTSEKTDCPNCKTLILESGKSIIQKCKDCKKNKH